MRRMVLGFVGTAWLAACGGASDSGGLFTSSGGSAQSDGGGQSTGGGTPPPPPPTGTTPAPPPPPPDPGPCKKIVYYEDNDGDGFGGPNTQSACTSPGGGWVTKGGDCDDNDASVFPGQPSYFTAPYSTSGGGESFDYDCNKKEEEEPPPAQAATACGPGVNVGTCVGDGYLPVDTRPAGVGIDRLCGSTHWQVCTYKPGQGICIASVTTKPAVACH